MCMCMYVVLFSTGPGSASAQGLGPTAPGQGLGPLKSLRFAMSQTTGGVLEGTAGNLGGRVPAGGLPRPASAFPRYI